MVHFLWRPAAPVDWKWRGAMFTEVNLWTIWVSSEIARHFLPPDTSLEYLSAMCPDMDDVCLKSLLGSGVRECRTWGCWWRNSSRRSLNLLPGFLVQPLCLWPQDIHPCSVRASLERRLRSPDTALELLSALQGNEASCQRYNWQKPYAYIRTFYI